jgi:hypothetical protein
LRIIAASQLNSVLNRREAEMSETEYETAIAEFIRSKGITRSPTVCLAPTQASASVSDRMTLRRRAEQREELRREKLRILSDPRLPPTA